MDITPKWKVVGTWALCVLLSLVFLMAGASKLMGVQMHVDNFARWGYPQWFRSVVGATEVVAAVLLVIPRTTLQGASVLILVMVGAVGTHVLHGEWGMVLPPLVLGGLAALAGRARTSAAVRPAPR